MPGFARVLIALVLVAALSAGFAFGFCAWWRLPDDMARGVLVIHGGALVLALVLFVAGQAMAVRALAFYIIMGGAVFLAVDVIVWLRYGFMPGNKMLRNGFIPAGLMGVFAGALYAKIAIPAANPPRDYLH